MKPALMFAALMICGQAQLKAQPDSTRKIKPYLVRVETMVGKNERGILHKVNSDTLELLPYSNKYRPFIGSKMHIDESIRIKLTAGQIQSFTIQRKGAMGSAISLGTLVGGITGGIVGTVTAPKSNCTFCGLERAGYIVTATFIGVGAGALTGFLIAKSKQKKFIIGGNKQKFLDLHAELMEKAYFNQ